MPPSPTSPIPSQNHGTGACDSATRDGGTNVIGGDGGVTAPSPEGPRSFATVLSSGAGGAKSPLSKDAPARPTSNVSKYTHNPPVPSITSSSSKSPSSLGDFSFKSNDQSKGSLPPNGDSGDSSATAFTSPHSSGPASSDTSPYFGNSEGEVHESSDDCLEEDSESSDVEIYLAAGRLDDSASRMHVYGNIAADTSITSATSATTGQNPPSHLQSQVYTQGLHHHSMTTDPEFINACNYSSTRDHGPQPQQGQPQILLPTGASGNHNRGLGVSSISQSNSSCNLNDAPLDNSLSSLATTTTNASRPTFPSSQQQQGLFPQHPYRTSSAATVVDSRQQTPLPGAPFHTSISLTNMDPPVIQQPEQYSFFELGSTSPSPMPPAYDAPTIDLTTLSISGPGSLAADIADIHHGVSQMGMSGMMATAQSQPVFASNYTHNPYDHPPASSATTRNAPFATSLSEPQLGVSTLDTAHDDPNGVKTPNVYINGLPPHFPEDELFNLTCEFGPILSVRTFTRHVRDSESGYGFVLFERVDDAEKCIENLRKFKNLHPTFSKQIHKIPGTSYAAGPSTASSSSYHGSGGLDSNVKSSFKAKMESLHDPTSTNLYMEGLPNCVDEYRLAALVTPHRVVSHRFFQTRLSNPPRVIAFVRLDTRVGAEEIIARLHGRNMKGYEDVGCRVSVRFADTSEQRELRRTERSIQDGDVSPSRLTIAQASLLNLHGQELRPTNRLTSSHSHSSLLVPPSTSGRGFPASVSVPELSSNPSMHLATHASPDLPVIGITGRSMQGSHGFEVDYSLGSHHGAMGSHRSLRPLSPYALQEYQAADYSNGVGHGIGGRGLLENLHQNGAQYRSHGFSDSLVDSGVNSYLQAGSYQGLDSRVLHQQLNGGLSHSNLQQLQQLSVPRLQDLDVRQFVRSTPVYTRTGYTPTEEYIMRTHSNGDIQHHQRAHDLGQQDRRRPAPLDLNGRAAVEDGAARVGGMRGLSSAMPSALTSTSTLSGLQTINLSNGGRTAGLGEDPLQSNSASSLRSARVGREAGPAQPFYMTAQGVYANGSSPPLSTSDNDQQGSSPTFSPSTALTSPDPNEVLSAYHRQGSVAHARSSTLPQQRQQATARRPRGHLSHNSMSMPKPNAETPQHASVARLPGHNGIDSRSDGVIYESNEQIERAEAMTDACESARSPQETMKSTLLKSRNSGALSDVDPPSDSPMSASSTLISPTLTYSAQTPSTLSPATPFFNSFNNHLDGFEKGAGVAMDHSTARPRRKTSAELNGEVAVARGLRG